MAKLPVKVVFSWVKGHADDRKEEADFTWAEYLNVGADIMATLGRYRHCPADEGHWPEQVVSVVGKKGRILGRLANELRYESTIDDLVSKYCERYGWSDADYALIDHEGFQKAMSGLKGGPRRRLQLLRCGWLPTNRRVARQDKDRLSTCEACGSLEIEETIDHVFQCPTRLRRTLILKELDEMNIQFKKWKTNSSIIDAMYTGVRAWIEGDDIPSVDDLSLPDTDIGRLVGRAYSEQTLLGWSSFLRGFRAASWRKAQEAEFRNLPPWMLEKRDRGDAWSGWTITWFITFFEKIWKLRNETQFGVTPESKVAKRTKIADRGIRSLYKAGETLSYHERQPFRLSLASMLALPIATKESWVQDTRRWMTPARQRDERRAAKQPAITDYFSLQVRDGPT
jgi:hypothetical protein